jgi:hypothetical protein
MNELAIKCHFCSTTTPVFKSYTTSSALLNSRRSSKMKKPNSELGFCIRATIARLFHIDPVCEWQVF